MSARSCIWGEVYITVSGRLAGCGVHEHLQPLIEIINNHIFTCMYDCFRVKESLIYFFCDSASISFSCFFLYFASRIHILWKTILVPMNASFVLRYTTMRYSSLLAFAQLIIPHNPSSWDNFRCHGTHSKLTNRLLLPFLNSFLLSCILIIFNTGKLPCSYTRKKTSVKPVSIPVSTLSLTSKWTEALKHFSILGSYSYLPDIF